MEITELINSPIWGTMQTFIKSISKKSEKIYRQVSSDEKICSDLCSVNKHIPVPFSEALSLSNIRLVIIGQDPTVRKEKTRSEIKSVLMLDESKHLKNYIYLVCNELGISFSEIYATNLYKCFFNEPPQDNERILTRHFRYWIEILIEEVSKFPDAAIITLGQPVIRQLIHTGKKDVKFYWDYIGHTKSNENYSGVPAGNNFLQRTFWPFPHLPTYNQNQFYKKYFKDYANFLKKSI